MSQLIVFRNAIAASLSKITGIEASNLSSLLEVPKKKGTADFALPLPRLNQFKKLPGNPAKLATEWAALLQPDEYLESCTAAGPYLNFNINKRTLSKGILSEVYQTRDKFGHSNIGAGKTVIVEFSSPNIAKPFHAGHLRSTIIGNFLKNLHDALGYKTVGINYLGDWGKQYGLLAVGFNKYGSEEKLQAAPVIHLYEVYVQINKDLKVQPEVDDAARAYFRKMEDGDPEALAMWRKFRDLSIQDYMQTYKRLNVHFDVYSGESLMSEGMVKAYAELEQMGLLQDSEGAKIVDLKDKGLGAALVKKNDGTTLYITRDIAAAIDRHETYKFDKMFYVVAAQQNFHFQQLFALLGKMGKDWVNQCTHINFGMVKGMSTRKGEVVFLSDILHEAQQVMLDTMKKNEKKFAEIEDPVGVADKVGIAAVLIQDLGSRRIKDYDFEWSRMTSFEGDTGPYLQYAHARCASMERKTGINVHLDIDFSLFTEPVSEELLYQIARFPEVVASLADNLESSTLITYLFKLSHTIAQAHDKLWVLGQEKPLAEARMLLFWAAKVTLANGLRILGLEPLQRM